MNVWSNGSRRGRYVSAAKTSCPTIYHVDALQAYSTSAAEIGLAVQLASMVLAESFAAASSAQGGSTGSMLLIVPALCAFAKFLRQKAPLHLDFSPSNFRTRL